MGRTKNERHFAFLSEDSKVYRIISLCRSSIQKKKERNTKKHYEQSSHECCIETNGEPVAADIFYHPLPVPLLSPLLLTEY